MAQALIVLEKNKIIHRDIKAQNIFITIDGSFKLG
jgi:serine/threonine protein kinase